MICSALGRAPDPYATDTLLSLLGPAHGGPNRDLLLAVGEMISCAVFAELLTSWGAEAQAMTGEQAGILTDNSWCDANIKRVDPRNLVRAIVNNVIPVVAGFQGADENNAITTLGRGGSDLTAIALGDALGADSVDIYTDVSGVMSGDPRRIAGAHTVDRVNWSEMVELAGNGAKVMHAKAATLAQRGNTPYVIKGLRSNFGTAIDEGIADRPGSPGHRHDGAARHRVRPHHRGRRRRCQTRRARPQLLHRVAERGISIDMINVNEAGVFFVCDHENVENVREELRDLNLAVRVRPHCAKISIVGAGMRGTPGVMYRVVRSVSDAGVEIIHSTDSNITISVLVPEEDAQRAEQALHDDFHLGRRSADEPIRS